MYLENFLTMENQHIELYLLACHVYDARSETCFQRPSNYSKPDFTDHVIDGVRYVHNALGYPREMNNRRFSLTWVWDTSRQKQ